LLKPEQLRKNPAKQVAVQQAEVCGERKLVHATGEAKMFYQQLIRVFCE
jgi:hypothetical protein